ncbi:MAG TPA: lytic transglycosylase domain-containing protein [Bryobacteraceae bacterium]|nr:lytic transglycosylase domain-containing protein [Bryobacteraceae bacterium]
MKILTLAILVSAVVIAAAAYHLLNQKILRPVAVRLHIPAPAFTLNEMIRAVSRRQHIMPAMVKSIIAAESAFAPNAVSPKGAVGLMQLMPDTARQYGADPTVPEQNVDAGAHYLSWLLQRYAHTRDQMRRAIAAYNAGPGAVARCHGVPPFRETRAYVSRVLRLFGKFEREEPGGPPKPRPAYLAVSVTTRSYTRLVRRSKRRPVALAWLAGS